MANVVKSAHGTTDIRVAEMKPIYPEMTVDTDFLIVGAGPAGASLGCFLGKYGRELRITFWFISDHEGN